MIRKDWLHGHKGFGIVGSDWFFNRRSDSCAGVEANVATVKWVDFDAMFGGFWKRVKAMGCVEYRFNIVGRYVMTLDVAKAVFLKGHIQLLGDTWVVDR